MYKIFFTNHLFYANENFDTIEHALNYGKREFGYELVVLKVKPESPYAFSHNDIVATWSMIDGVKIKGDDSV